MTRARLLVLISLVVCVTWIGCPQIQRAVYNAVSDRGARLYAVVTHPDGRPGSNLVIVATTYLPGKTLKARVKTDAAGRFSLKAGTQYKLPELSVDASSVYLQQQENSSLSITNRGTREAPIEFLAITGTPGVGLERVTGGVTVPLNSNAKPQTAKLPDCIRATNFSVDVEGGREGILRIEGTKAGFVVGQGEKVVLAPETGYEQIVEVPLWFVPGHNKRRYEGFVYFRCNEGPTYGALVLLARELEDKSFRVTIYCWFNSIGSRNLWEMPPIRFN